MEFCSHRLKKGFDIPEDAKIKVESEIEDSCLRYYDGLVHLTGIDKPYSFHVTIVKLEVENKDKKKQAQLTFKKDIVKITRHQKHLSITPEEEQEKLADLERKLRERQEGSKASVKTPEVMQPRIPSPMASPRKPSASVVASPQDSYEQEDRKDKTSPSKSSPRAVSSPQDLYDKKDKKDKKAQKLIRKNRSQSVSNLQKMQSLRMAQGKMLAKQASLKSLQKAKLEKSSRDKSPKKDDKSPKKDNKSPKKEKQKEGQNQGD